MRHDPELAEQLLAETRPARRFIPQLGAGTWFCLAVGALAFAAVPGRALVALVTGS
jgi:hypothetical protein